MRDKATLLFTLVGMLLVAAPARAQVAWESPLLVAPGTTAGLGIFLVDPHPGDILAVMVTYRAAGAPGGMGWRAGLTEDIGDHIALFGGFDFSGPLRPADSEFPLDMIWVAGIGGSYFDEMLTVGFPAAVMAGRTLSSPNATFTPYIGPRLVLNGTFGGDRPGESDEDVDLELAVDFGVDLAFASNWLIRFGATLGDRDALAIGAVFGGGS